MESAGSSEKPKSRGLEILYRGLVWAFVGALYAAMFLPVFEVTNNVLTLWVAPILATVAATAGGAMVYSSSQLAIQVALFGNIGVFGYLVISGVVVSPLGPTVVGAAIGAVIGGVYGLIVKKSKIYQADAKLMAAVLAGGAVSVIGVVWVFVAPYQLVWLVALLAPVSGMAYLKLTDIFVPRYHGLLPPFVDGALAGVLIGGFIGFGLWLMAGVALDEVVPGWLAAFNRLTGVLPGAIAAASATTFILGMLKAAFKLDWGDPYE